MRSAGTANLQSAAPPRTGAFVARGARLGHHGAGRAFGQRSLPASCLVGRVRSFARVCSLRTNRISANGCCGAVVLGRCPCRYPRCSSRLPGPCCWGCISFCRRGAAGRGGRAIVAAILSASLSACFKAVERIGCSRIVSNLRKKFEKRVLREGSTCPSRPVLWNNRTKDKWFQMCPRGFC